MRHRALSAHADHRLVERRALALQAVPVRIHRDRIRNAALRLRHVGEAAHPDAVAPTSRWLSVLWIEPKNAPRSRRRSSSRQRIGHAIEIGVLPAIVARHAPHIGGVDHLCPRREMDRLELKTAGAVRKNHAAAAVSLRQRGLGLLDDGLECRRLADREIGQHLAIDRDAGLREPVDKPAVGEAEGPHRGVEALDPQRPEGALAPLAVAEGVLVGLLHRLLGDADGVLAPAVKALGGLENFLVLGVGRDAPFDAGHG